MRDDCGRSHNGKTLRVSMENLSDFFKALVLRDDHGKLNEVDKVLNVAKAQGSKTFKGSRFKVVGVHGPFQYGWVAVYRFERCTVPMSEGNRQKKPSEN